MNTRKPDTMFSRSVVKLAVFGVVLGAAVGGGALIGTAIGPSAQDRSAPNGGNRDQPTTETTMDMDMDMDMDMTETTAAAGMDMGIGGEALPMGLAVSRGGYTLNLADGELPADSESELAFTITGPDGRPVTDFDVVHDKELHLVIVSRDLVGYAHLHPSLDDDGTWRVPVPALAPGSYRVFADFTPAGADRLTLGADLAVPGDFAPAALPEPSDTATLEGYTVTLGGTVVAGQESELTMTISLDGEPVADLDPYLGALGHLVAIRGGDMAYLHVHPTTESAGPGGPDVPFIVTAPTAGTYRLFFDFSHEGDVRTAAFTVVAEAVGEAETLSPETTMEGM